MNFLLNYIVVRRGIFLWGFLYMSFLSLNANNFEGSITWLKQSLYDTTYYTYYVSQNRIRIEEKDVHFSVRKIYIINIEKEDVFIIDPIKKMYTKLNKNKDFRKETNQFIVNKTDNYKVIKGVKCYQWRVKNVQRNTEVTYWVAQKNFDFFEKMVKILNNTDKSWDYFNCIPQNSGFFPMIYEERTLLRDKKSQMSVLKIELHHIDSSLFKIPQGYTLFIM